MSHDVDYYFFGGGEVTKYLQERIIAMQNTA